jgi:hypothetical protein
MIEEIISLCKQHFDAMHTPFTILLVPEEAIESIFSLCKQHFDAMNTPFTIFLVPEESNCESNLSYRIGIQ